MDPKKQKLHDAFNTFEAQFKAFVVQIVELTSSMEQAVMLVADIENQLMHEFFNATRSTIVAMGKGEEIHTKGGAK